MTTATKSLHWYERVLWTSPSLCWVQILGLDHVSHEVMAVEYRLEECGTGVLVAEYFGEFADTGWEHFCDHVIARGERVDAEPRPGARRRCKHTTTRPSDVYVRGGDDLLGPCPRCGRFYANEDGSVEVLGPGEKPRGRR